ncbi:MAG TPA: choice-of-anchor E domain-containing protein, partial [Opitutaceae bacterium]|nr:choice-of-anchor E domain-containing protein [Opitutaceae bacterium]
MRKNLSFYLALFKVGGYLLTPLLLVITSSLRADTSSGSSTFSLSHSAAVTTGTVSILGSKTESTSHGPVSVTLPKFSPALGTLTGATVTVTSTTGTAGVKNTGLLSLLSGGSYSRTLKVDLSAGTLTRTSQESLLTSGGTLLTLLGLGGTQEAGGPMLSTTFTINQTSDLAALTGTGDFSLSFSATNTLTIYTLASIFNGAGYSVSGLYAGNVSVTYTFTPPAIAPSIITQPTSASIDV